MSGVDVGGEFVVAATHVLEGVPCTDHVRWTERVSGSAWAAAGTSADYDPVSMD
jgi:hypothetical protein